MLRVRWTKPAADDLTDICDYTEERFGPTQARRAALTLYDAAESLREMPLRGRTGRKGGTLELPMPGLPFLIVYRVRREAAVEILRVLHGARQWP